MPSPIPDIGWVPGFLKIIPYRVSISAALREVGISKQRLSDHINRSPEFRKKYYEAKSLQMQKMANIAATATTIKSNARAEMQIAKKERAATEFREFRDAMKSTGGNLLATSKICSVSRQTIYRRLRSDRKWADIYMRYR